MGWRRLGTRKYPGTSERSAIADAEAADGKAFKLLQTREIGVQSQPLCGENFKGSVPRVCSLLLAGSFSPGVGIFSLPLRCLRRQQIQLYSPQE